MPEMGESVTEGIVLEWHVAEGDFVNEGDTVVEVSTDKVDAEVPAPTDGVITKLIASVDDEVPVGAPLAEMEPGEGDGTAEGSNGSAAGPVAGEGPAGEGAAPFSAPPPRHPQAEPLEPLAGPTATAMPTSGRRRWRGGLLRATGVDLGSVSGSGPGAKVTKEDVLAAANGGGGCAAAAAGEAKPLRGPAAMLATGDGREPGGADRDLVPDDRRRHARRQAQGAERGAQRARDEGLLHPPRRLGDRRRPPRTGR